MSINEKITAFFPQHLNRPAYQYTIPTNGDRNNLNISLLVDLFRIQLDQTYNLLIEVFDDGNAIKTTNVPIQIKKEAVNDATFILDGDTIIATNTISIKDVPLPKKDDFQLIIQLSLFKDNLLLDGPVKTYLNLH
jgi:hypothetical protein